jgi:hypothetical protein
MYDCVNTTQVPLPLLEGVHRGLLQNCSWYDAAVSTADISWTETDIWGSVLVSEIYSSSITWCDDIDGRNFSIGDLLGFGGVDQLYIDVLEKAAQSCSHSLCVEAVGFTGNPDISGIGVSTPWI